VKNEYAVFIQQVRASAYKLKAL